MYLFCFCRSLNIYYFFCLTFILVAFFSPSKTFAQKTDNLTASKSICWNSNDKNIGRNHIASDKEAIFVAYLNGYLASINIKTGIKNWTANLGGEIVSDPLIDKYDNTKVYIATKPLVPVDKQTVVNKISDGTVIRSINKVTGITNWKIDIKTTEEVFLYDNGESLIIISKDGKVLALNKLSVQPIWEISFGDTLTTVPFFSENSVTVTFANKIVSVSLKDASIYFQTELLSPATSLFGHLREKVFWGDEYGKVFRLNSFYKRSKANLWKFQNGAKISRIILTTKGLLLTSLDNFVYLISAEKGRLIWKKRLAGRITLDPLVNGEFVILSSSSNSEASVLDLNTGKIINQISLAEGNFFLSPPVLTDSLLIFATAKGIFAFKDSFVAC